MQIENKVFRALCKLLIVANFIEVMICKKHRTGCRAEVEVVNAVAWIRTNRKKMIQPR